MPAVTSTMPVPSVSSQDSEGMQPSWSDGSSGALVVVIDSDSESDAETDTNERQETLARPKIVAKSEVPHAPSRGALAEPPAPAGVAAAAQPTRERPPQPRFNAPVKPETACLAAAESFGDVAQHREALMPGAGQAALPAPSAAAELLANPARVATCRRTFRRFGKQQAAFDCADRWGQIHYCKALRQAEAVI